MRKFRDLRPFRRPERSFPLVMIGRRIGRGAFRQVCYRLGFRMPARRDASEGRQSTSEPTGGAFASASPSRGRHLMVGRGLEGGAGACLNRLVCSGRLPLREVQRAVATNWIAAAYLRYVGRGRPADVAHPGTRWGLMSAGPVGFPGPPSTLLARSRGGRPGVAISRAADEATARQGGGLATPAGLPHPKAAISASAAWRPTVAGPASGGS